jgi:hypothetical protein
VKLNSEVTYDKKDSIKRKYFRYKPKLFIYVLISKEPKVGESQTEYAGLVIQEAYGGCAIATSSDLSVKKHDIVIMKSADMPAVRAEVRWRKKLDKDLIRIGVQYLGFE